MHEWNIVATHSCGHTERHTGGSASPDGAEYMMAFFAKEKCSTCHPRCEYCNRTGDREDMLVLEVNCYSTEEEVAAAKVGHVFCNDWCHQQALHPTHYCEHNDIEIPGFLRNWEDTSYHNDTCGSSMLVLVKGDEETQRAEIEVRVWVEHTNPDEREGSDRFVVELLADGENPRGADCDWLYAGDDAAVAAQWARAAEHVASGEPADADIADMVTKIHQLIKTTEVK